MARKSIYFAEPEDVMEKMAPVEEDLGEETSDETSSEEESTKSDDNENGDPYFWYTSAKGDKVKAYNVQHAPDDPLIKPAEYRYLWLDPADWSSVDRPVNWSQWPASASRPWPPRSTLGIAKADGSEQCVGIVANSSARCQNRNCGHSYELNGQWAKYKSEWQDFFELRETPPYGIGAFYIGSGAIVVGDVFAEYTGALKPHSESFGPRYDITGIAGAYLSALEVGPGGSKCFVDANKFGNWTRFLNHSCDPNAKLLAARVGAYRILGLEATKKIRKGTEITIEYGEQFFQGTEYCYCGASKCRNPPPSETDGKRSVQEETDEEDRPRKRRRR